ncbi:MAG: SET domain-containing protein-lysine N-methyltransferase [Candidatus Aenigmatarchaeota archaeon]|nr:MAG: SET domain-containing protein-lysine N-methyltransferase [Candidatus Aenigmarchaeota archaeon]
MEDLHARWPHRWLTPKAVVKSSRIHGLGIFCGGDIAKGETVLVAGGVIVPCSEISEYRKIMGIDVGAQIDDDFFICPTNREELEDRGVVNHSCNPNIGMVNSISLGALRKIRADEELVMDYAFHETSFEPFKCNCGSANCRGTIRPTDWRLPELQKKYGKYFSPYLQRKFMK